MTTPNITFVQERAYADEEHLVASVGGDEVGSVQFSLPDPEDDGPAELWVYNITVLEEFRGRGIAIALLDELVRRHPAERLGLDQGTIAGHGVVRAWLRSHGVLVELPKRFDQQYDIGKVRARGNVPGKPNLSR